MGLRISSFGGGFGRFLGGLGLGLGFRGFRRDLRGSCWGNWAGGLILSDYTNILIFVIIYR